MISHKKKILSLFLLLLIILISLLAYFFMSKGKSGDLCQITLHGNVIKELPLAMDTVEMIKTEKGYNTIKIENGFVYVAESDCKNQICVQSGKISKDSQIISCLPHELIITIISSNGEVDTIAY